jgi:hypothetical protein
MRFRLRTLLIVLALGPPVIALAWWYWKVALDLLPLALLFPYLILLSLARMFDALCQLIGVKPRGDSAENSN